MDVNWTREDELGTWDEFMSRNRFFGSNRVSDNSIEDGSGENATQRDLMNPLTSFWRLEAKRLAGIYGGLYSEPSGKSSRIVERTVYYCELASLASQKVEYAVALECSVCHFALENVRRRNIREIKDEAVELMNRFVREDKPFLAESLRKDIDKAILKMSSQNMNPMMGTRTASLSTTLCL